MCFNWSNQFHRQAESLKILPGRIGQPVVGDDPIESVESHDEPAVDLGIVVAIASSVLNQPVDTKTVFIGEVGLTGEVRGVSQIEVRLKEASKLGFKSCVLPEVNRERINTDLPIDLSGVSSVKEVLNFLWTKGSNL